jgi:hypothetical protein
LITTAVPAAAVAAAGPPGAAPAAAAPARLAAAPPTNPIARPPLTAPATPSTTPPPKAAAGPVPGDAVPGMRPVDAAEGVARTDLAAAVRDVLVGAGLPVVDDGVNDGHGAQVEIDLGDDAAGGVFVTWRAGASHVEDANRSLLDGGFDDVPIRRTGVVGTAMRDAMITILDLAGFDATPSDDDMRPVALRVRPPAASRG